jgi:hypothetical protein
MTVINEQDDENTGTLGEVSEDHEQNSEENSENHEEEGSEVEAGEDLENEGEEDNSSKKKHKNGFATRLAREREKTNKALREAEYWKSMASSSKHSEDEPEPDEANYNGDVKKYAADLAKYHAKKTVAEMRKEDQEREQEHRQSQINSTWQDQVDEVLEEHPDYHEKLKAVENVQVHNSVLDEIRDSDHGARIMYYLASNPKLAKEISKLSVKDAVKRIHKIEHIIENSDSMDTRDHKPIQQSKAPHPTKPIKATTGSSADKRVDDMTPDELDKWIKAGNTVKFGK